MIDGLPLWVPTALNILAVGTFAAMWIYCQRRHVGPLELATELVGKAITAWTRWRTQ